MAFNLVGTSLNFCKTTFELKEKIGEGTFGVVYRAIDTTNRRDVAVKVIDLSLGFGPSSADIEIQALEALKGQPNVAELYCYEVFKLCGIAIIIIVA